MPSIQNLGDALVAIGEHSRRFLDAWGDGVVKMVEDFVAFPLASNASQKLTVTLVQAGASNTTVTAADESGGVLLITTDDAENDGANLQFLGESFKIQSTKPFYFGSRLKVSDATQSDFFIGLADTDTAILDNLPSRIGFRKVDGSTDLLFDLKATNTTSIEGTGTVADATYITVEFYFDGTSLTIYVDNTLIATVPTTNLPTATIRPSIHFLTGAAASKTCSVDWIRVLQFGR